MSDDRPATKGDLIAMKTVKLTVKPVVADVAEHRKEDLDRIANDIKEHIDERLLPIRKEIADYELILNGLIGEEG